MKVQAWRDIFLTNKATELSGRYITLDHIEPLIKRYGAMAEIKVIGSSVQRRPIYALQCGKGPVKILMWSQMHGNESTTTKAVFDLLNTFNSTHGSQFLKKLQITIIPMLNPDGAKRYTRHNANDVDLNRDAKSLSQPESRALRTIFDKLQPDYCFNLHGQRTIYSAGSQPKSAILSFLAPAENDEREITETRKKAMSVIVAMNKSLQQLIPDHIALYSDTYNPNCVGDAFQSLKSITILFEAGHIPGDYSRERVREYMFIAMVTAIQRIASRPGSQAKCDEYFSLPQNEERYFDIIIRNTASDDDLAIQYQEQLFEDEITFNPEIVQIGNLDNSYGHREIDARGKAVKGLKNELLKVGYANDCVRLNNELFSLKLIIS